MSSHSDFLVPRTQVHPSTISDLTSTIRALKKSSLFKQVLLSDKISSKIQMVYDSIDRALAEARVSQNVSCLHG